MKIAVLGAGAMGCLYAAILSGRNAVTLYDAIPAVVDAVNGHGVICREADGTERTCRIPARLAGDCDGGYDLVILFVKDLFSRSALETNRAVIGPDTLLLSLQNGMGNEEIMREFADPARILLGTTKHNCVTLAPGKIYHSGAGMTHIGSPVGNRAAAEKVAALFRESGADAEECDSVRHLLWEKLFVNMTVNPLTALLDAPIGTLATDPELQAYARALIDEAVRVTAADGERFDGEKAPHGDRFHQRRGRPSRQTLRDPHSVPFRHPASDSCKGKSDVTAEAELPCTGTIVQEKAPAGAFSLSGKGHLAPLR